MAWEALQRGAKLLWKPWTKPLQSRWGRKENAEIQLHSAVSETRDRSKTPFIFDQQDSNQQFQQQTDSISSQLAVCNRYRGYTGAAKSLLDSLLDHEKTGVPQSAGKEGPAGFSLVLDISPTVQY